MDWMSGVKIQAEALGFLHSTVPYGLGDLSDFSLIGCRSSFCWQREVNPPIPLLLQAKE